MALDWWLPCWFPYKSEMGVPQKRRATHMEGGDPAIESLKDLTK